MVCNDTNDLNCWGFPLFLRFVVGKRQPSNPIIFYPHMKNLVSFLTKKLFIITLPGGRLLVSFSFSANQCFYFGFCCEHAPLCFSESWFNIVLGEQTANPRIFCHVLSSIATCSPPCHHCVGIWEVGISHSHRWAEVNQFSGEIGNSIMPKSCKWGV